MSINLSEKYADQIPRLGRTTAQAVSRRSAIAEARLQSLVSPCWICGGGISIGTGLSASYLVFLVTFVPAMLHALSSTTDTLSSSQFTAALTKTEDMCSV
jgi:hypothetical protein